MALRSSDVPKAKRLKHPTNFQSLDLKAKAPASLSSDPDTLLSGETQGSL